MRQSTQAIHVTHGYADIPSGLGSSTSGQVLTAPLSGHQVTGTSLVIGRLRAKADHDARTHRYRVSGCRVDALKGGEFTLEC
jgi:hypothetical protein